jgi:hypothetical protein
MPIDDPLDQLQKQFDSEQRSSDPIMSRLAELASLLALAVAIQGQCV